jgi:PIN domain nuclease of toxin-antitoxin system
VILLDTHAMVWFANDDARLGKVSGGLADEALADNRLAVSAISFWEIALLFSKGRLTLRKTPAELHDELLNEGVLELPLTGAIAITSVELEGLHADPADRFIVATAIAHNATLVTADRNILNWKHALRRQDAEA